MTVSRALRQTGQVNPELTDKIRRVAEQLNYIPDQAAQALASSKSAFVGVLIPTLTNTVFADLLEAVHNILFPQGIQILIGNTHYSPEQEERLLRNFLSYRPSGLIVTGFDQYRETQKMINSSGIPCVHVMEISDDDSVYCVGLSNTEAAQGVVNYLLAKNRRRIAFIGAQNDSRTLQRLEGYRTALANNDLLDSALECNVPTQTSVGLGGELFREMMAHYSDVDAVFFSNDDLAQGAMFEALRLGIRIPDDVAIIGFNDIEQSAHSAPRMTTVHTPRTEIGTQAAKMLLNLMQGKTISPRSINVGFELIVRESA
ncbi:LacI family transcriptional regulator [Betaproteobacteria bacterium]|nr:LacI family transcriptional regulator [Betaproteobacteria bacterium]